MSDPETLAADVEGLAELERLAKAATPGPWVHFDRDPTQEIQPRNGDTRKPIVHWSGFDAAYGRFGTKRANARFIAAANPAAILKLIAALRSITETNRVQREQAAELASSLTQMKELFRFALLCSTPDIARDGMVFIRNAEALLDRTGASHDQ